MLFRSAAVNPTSDRVRRNARRTRFPLAIVVTLLLVAGCSTAATPSAPERTAPPTTAAVLTPAPTVGPTATATATPPSTPVPSAQALCANRDASGLSGCPLAAGTYTSAPFEVPFRFTIADGWANHIRVVQAGAIRKGPAIGFAWGVRLADVSPTIGASTDALFKFFRGQRVVTASDPVPVTIGGVEGSSMDVSVGKKGEILFHSSTADGLQGTSWRFTPGTKVRMIGVEVHDTLVLLMVDVSPVKAFDDEMAKIQPILDSIVWQ